MKLALLLVAAIGIVMIAGTTSSAYAAVDMFLKIDGVQGESKDSKHANEIDVLAWSWGVSNPATFGAGGLTSGKANFQSMSITKFVDKSSPELFLGVASGKHYKTADLVVRKAGGTQLEYIKYHFDDVLISSLSTGGSGGEDRLTENITFNFAKITFTYVPQKPDGSGDTPITVGWDIAKNVKV